jgi:hypothetical protein
MARHDVVIFTAHGKIKNPSRGFCSPSASANRLNCAVKQAVMGRDSESGSESADVSSGPRSRDSRILSRFRDGDAAVPFLLQLQGRHCGQDDAQRA